MQSAGSPKHNVTFRLIGAGKVGTTLARALVNAGYQLTEIVDHDEAAMAAARKILSTVALARSEYELLPSTTFTLIAIPDDRIGPLAKSLASGQTPLRGHIFVHVSGRYGYRILDPLEALGAACLAMHPAMAFAGDLQTDLTRIVGACFAVTSSDAATLDWGSCLVRELGGVPLPVNEDERVLYHTALAHGSNHLVTLVIQATEMLRQAGVTDSATVLLPLLAAALDNALQRGAAGATGPVVRGDVATVSAHLAELSRRLPSTESTYRTLSDAAVSTALQANRISEEQASGLRMALI